MEHVEHIRCYVDGGQRFEVGRCPCTCHPSERGPRVDDWIVHHDDSCTRFAANRETLDRTEVDWYQRTGQAGDDRLYGRDSTAVRLGESA